MFHYDFTRQVASNTHEWCAPHQPANSQFAKYPLAEIHSIVQLHRQGESVVIADVAQLEDELFRVHLQHQDIKCVDPTADEGERLHRVCRPGRRAQQSTFWAGQNVTCSAGLPTYW